MTGRASNRRPLELIVFDFDGTLCDSVDIKTEAFYDLYLDDHGPEVAGMVKDYHLANIGVSRYDKIRYVEAEVFGNDPSDGDVESVAGRYSQLVEEAVVAAPLFDGVFEFLASPPFGVRCAVASATPTSELRRIVDRKGLSEFFVAIEGSPRSKAEILRECVERFADSPHSIVMVGDQPSDADAARAVGTDGLFITPSVAWAASFARVDDFDSAAACLVEWVGVTP